MSINRLMNQPLTIQTVGVTGTDSYGNVTTGPVGSPVATVGYLDQKDTIEYLLNRDTVVSKWIAFLPSSSITDTFNVLFTDIFGTIGSTPIGPLDYINFGTQQFQVEGEPHHVFNPRTRSVSHIECKLIEVT
jgi:hypothetical protein